MKLEFILALVGVLTLAPVVSVSAADAKEKSAAAEAADDKPGPTDAEKAKARKLNLARKGKPFNRAADALKLAEQCDLPILAFLFKDDAQSKFIEQKLMTFKPFKEDLASKYFVILKLKVKTDTKSTAKAAKIDIKPLKEPERKIFENFGLDERAAATAARLNKDEVKFDDASNYPAVIAIKPDGTKALFRLPKYDTEGGPGVWISTVIDLLRTAGIEPELSKTLEKITENPTDPKAWK